jgi:putative phosphoribosyl transferase
MALSVPLDVVLVRKLGLPGHEEYAMGAVASGGVRVLQSDVLAKMGISMQLVDSVARRELGEIARRERLYRAGRAPCAWRGRIAIVVDDGMATGSTMMAALQAVRKGEPARVIAAIPVAAPDACRLLKAQCDELVCLLAPEPFYAVGLWYRQFEQVSDKQVGALLAKASRARQRQADDTGRAAPA